MKGLVVCVVAWDLVNATRNYPLQWNGTEFQKPIKDSFIDFSLQRNFDFSAVNCIKELTARQRVFRKEE